MTIQENSGPTTNEANNRVPNMIKLCYYLAIQIWKLVLEVCMKYIMVMSNSVNQHIITVGNNADKI
jgi:hypothetical protein